MGTIGCAAGYGEAESPYAICEGGAFSFHGCVLGCTASSPAFLDGVDTAAADLPVEFAGLVQLLYINVALHVVAMQFTDE